MSVFSRLERSLAPLLSRVAVCLSSGLASCAHRVAAVRRLLAVAAGLVAVVGGSVRAAQPAIVVEQPSGTPLIVERSVVAWGLNDYGQTTVPAGLSGVQAIAAGIFHTVALKSDGAVVAWGWNESGQSTVPAGLAGVQAMAAGRYHTVALKSDGAVVAWGDNYNGQTTVPAGLTRVQAIAAGLSHTVALTIDGAVAAWGNDGDGQVTVPAGVSGVQAIAAGGLHTVALKSDGTVAAWGRNGFGQTTVPAGLSGVQAIAAGLEHTVALKSDGTVVAWGYNDGGQTTVPAGLTGVQAIAAGGLHTVALKSDGTVVAWGGNTYGQTTVPAGLSGVQAIAAGQSHTVALVRTATAVMGTEEVEVAGAPVSFTIRNTGDADLTLGAFTKGGANAGDFAVSAPGSTTIVSGGSTTFTVTFTPGGGGARTATLRIPNNDPTCRPFDIALSGTGVSSNATLSALAVGGGTLNEPFEPETTSYTANVPHTISSLVLSLTQRHSGGTMTVNGAIATPGQPSAGVPLAVGATTITIVVTAQDGTTTKSYRVVVTRAGLPQIVVEQPIGTPLVVARGVVAWGDLFLTTLPDGLTGVQAIAAGDGHTVVLKNDGTVVAWGWSGDGQTTVPPELAGVQAIAAGAYHTVALKSDGTVVAWGKNDLGQTTVPAGLAGVQAIAAGAYHTVALKSDGTVVAWGYHAFGQTTVPEGLAGVQAIAAGAYHTVALKSDGTVVAWGRNTSDQMAVPGELAGVQAIAAGYDHTVALKSDGTVVAWGKNDLGQTTVPAGLAGVQAIAAGAYHTVALKSDGTVVAWGKNNLGQTTVPAGVAGVQAIAAGPNHTVALVRAASPAAMGTGEVEVTGAPVSFTIRNRGTADLTLGSFTKDGANAADFAVSAPASTTIAPDGSTTFTVTFTPGGVGARTATLRIPNNDPAARPFEIALSGTGTPSTNATVSALALGVGALNETFDPARTSYTANVPYEVSNLTLTPTNAQSGASFMVNGVSVTSGQPSAGLALAVGANTFTIVVTAQDGVTTKSYPVVVTRAGLPHLVVEQPSGTALVVERRVVAWGGNTYGQTTVPAGLAGVQAIAAGDLHTVALKSDGTLVGWGDNVFGQTTVPAGLTEVQAIAAGYYHTVALTSNGTVVAWPDGFPQAAVPAGSTGVQAIAAGVLHTVTLKSDGTVVAWGDNTFGQTTAPAGLAGVQAIAAGGHHTVVLKSDGTVVAWGRNDSGQTTVPAGLAGVKAIAANGLHTVALKSDGTVVAWGNNEFGQTTVPSGLAGVQAIAAGDNHTVALKSDGTVVAWGRNDSGQTTVPAGLAGVQTIAAGLYHSVALGRAASPAVMGTGEVDAAGASASFTIRNTGNADLSLGVFTKDGVDAADFVVSAPASTTIVAGGNTTFTVTFTPSGVGARTATLRIPNNDPTATPFEIALSGTGTPSTNATVSALTLSVGALDETFDPVRTSYTASVSYETTALTLTAIKAQGNASITVNGVSVASGQPSPQLTLAVGATTFTIVVTAQDGTTTKTYTVTITRAAPPIPPAKQPQTITFGAPADAVLGQTVTLSASASSGLTVTFSVVSGPATLSGRTLTTTGAGLVTVRATQSGNSSYSPAAAVERSFLVTAGLPPTPVAPPSAGGSTTLTVPGSAAGLTYQWQRNGQDLAGAAGATVTLTNLQPSSAGLYSYTAQTASGALATSEPVIVGVSTTEKVAGTGVAAGADIVHPNGNVYDQLLLEGSGASFTADPGQITRMSFVDLSDDIVQVEFSGAGTLSLVMDGAPVPAAAANYNQPGVNYVRGNVGIVITGANETSNVSVFSVGRITAVNQTLFLEGVAYDGVANVAFIAIQSTNGRFGGVRTGNVEYFASQGFTGLYAPGVAFSGPVNIGDIQAYDSAQPVLVVGSASNVRIAGGTLAQPNGRPIKVDGLTRLTMAPGQTSQGDALPAQTNQSVLEQDGVDVTDLIVTIN